MEVLVGKTFDIEVAAASAATFVRDRPPQEKTSSSSTASLFLKEEEDDDDDDVGGGSDRQFLGVSSESSSSIGSPGDSDDEEEEGDGAVSSGTTGGSLVSLDSLEDSLPIKRGLSSHYAGKSKSFTNLSDINSSTSTVKELQKAENPFNKRRRLLLANKWSRKSSFYSFQNPKSMPLLALPLNEDDEDADADADGDGDGEDKVRPSSSSSSSSSPSSSSSTSNDKISSVVGTRKPRLQQSKLIRASFKSQSCFSLTDLHVEHQ